MVISNQTEADEICNSFLNEPVIAIDTEFLWTKTYHPIASIIQISSPSQHCIIDLLSIKDYTPIALLLSSKSTKIFHSASQDLKILKKITNISCQNVFDSQLATAFLNIGYQISYTNLIKHYCGVNLQTKVSHYNWLKRPLSSKQIQYALDDVIYLIKTYPILVEELKKNEKYDWFLEELSTNYSESFYKDSLLPNYQGIKDWNKLSQQQLAILDELANTRDKIAQKVNKRPHFVLHNKELIKLSCKKFIDNSVLKSINIPLEINKKEFLDVIIQAWNKGKNKAPKNYPILPKRHIKSSFYKNSEIKLKQLILQKAQEYNLHPSLLLSRDKQKKIINHWENNTDISKVLNKWRQSVLMPETTQLFKEIYA